MNGLAIPIRLRKCTGPAAFAGLVVLLLAFSAVGSHAEERTKVDADRWRNQKVESIQTRIPNAESSDHRLELQARQSWLRRWTPGQMPSSPADAPDETGLVDEPLLANLDRPKAIQVDDWRTLIALQTRLLASDTDEERKENLRTTIELARQLEAALSRQLSSESKSLTAPTGWVLAYTRYRLGRALAYRELPDVREVWPISDPDQYEEQLVAAYGRLMKQTDGKRREFILLQDRMFRRSGKKGRALELLEANRNSIEPKWYLKKRRDLLQELGWDPPYREAAQRYLQAGYDDES
ncbi:hypothetical protein [Neorhodopirellula lusitana]|uniref:hypothetical protein n=1 Tax=Neorhodopirellula lusitana TaxID=445327 RepID=UPI00384DD5A4